MAERRHHYQVGLQWTGNFGVGTQTYEAYGRNHLLTAPGRPAIDGSSEPAFRGDPARWNPEQLLVAALAACHQLWYLHLCAEAGIAVIAYVDAAEGVMTEGLGGTGRFTSVTLRPQVTIAAGSDPAVALALHGPAAEHCFIARSVAFPVLHDPQVSVAAA